MSRNTPCPECNAAIDPVEAARRDECPECRTYFGRLLDAALEGSV